MSEKEKDIDDLSKIQEQEKQYAVNFARQIFNLMNTDYFSPTTKNKILKDLNMNPVFKDRDNVEKMIANPKHYEKPLRELSQHLYNVIMPIKRLVDHYATMLTWDYMLIPIVENNVMKTSAFKKADNKVYDWIEMLNPKKSFSKLLRGALIEDAKFYYYRESENGIVLQEMPSDYCLITYQDEISYRYSFNMNYFLRSGVDIDGFAPEFKQYYADIFINGSKSNKYNGYNWVELNPDKAFVFKFDMLRAGLTPPLIGLFIDAAEIDTYRNLKKSKTALEAYKLIMGTIPRHKDNKTGNKRDDFALSKDMAAQFASLIKNSMPEGVDFKVTPFENHEVFEFEGSANQQDITASALKNFINNSGSSQVMSIDKPTQSTVKTAEKIEEEFVRHIYSQAEDFINYMLKKISPKYKYKIKFEGTKFDRDVRVKEAKEWAALGVITDKIAASMGLNGREFDKMIQYMQSRGYPLNLTPMASSFQTGDDKKGRPQKNENEISDNGAISKDHDLN